MQTLLIIDEDKRDRQAIRAAVLKSEVPVEMILECDNGATALDIINNQNIDAIFTEIKLTSADGIKMCKDIKNTKDGPQIVVISGSNEFADAIELLRIGVREYLLKPINPKQINEILLQLEEEIKINDSNQLSNSVINIQQIKQLLDHKKVSVKEREYILKNNNSNLFQSNYVVCCTSHMEQEHYITENKAYLGSVEDSEVYILREDLIKSVTKQEWRRSFIGISQPCSDLVNFVDAYNQAKQARILSYFKEKHIVNYSGQKQELQPYNLDKEEITKLVNILGTNKATQVEKKIQSYLWDCTLRNDINLLENIMGIFLQEVKVLFRAIVKEDDEDIMNLSMPLSYSNIKTYEYALIQWIHKFSAKVEEELGVNKNKLKVKEAIRFIEENYDKDFNMAVVSNHVSMNYTLFSIAFKEHTGTNFVTYLKQIRMNKAKYYLEETDTKIIEISQKIGYENEKHFMKVFKATYGISPTEYRKNAQINM